MVEQKQIPLVSALFSTTSEEKFSFAMLPMLESLVRISLVLLLISLSHCISLFCLVRVLIKRKSHVYNFLL